MSERFYLSGGASSRIEIESFTLAADGTHPAGVGQILWGTDTLVWGSELEWV